MAQCPYCGKAAGFLRKFHKQCKETFVSGEKRIVSLVSEVADRAGDLSQLESKIQNIAEHSYIDNTALQTLVAAGWGKVVEDAFDDGVVTRQEEDFLAEIANHFGLSSEMLDRTGARTRLVKGAVLRDILEGELPHRINIEGNLPFNLQKTEEIVWVFQNVDYYEVKTRSHFVGGSRGVSVRIAKGVYYRTGSFKGERVQVSETVHADTGLMGITNKHIYFSGSVARFRIRYEKIVSFESYEDGIGLQRDAASAKPQSFVTGDGWFTYNLITNLAQM